MKTQSLFLAILVCFGGLAVINAADDFKTSPVDTAELEAFYTSTIEKRVADIMVAVNLSDGNLADEVHSVIVNQYRALRARDAIIDDNLKARKLKGAEAQQERAVMKSKFNELLHKSYLESLANYLTPAQIEVVKDKMTYGKVDITFNAYCAMLPDLKDNDKKMIREHLLKARENAMDAGSADEKHAIFSQFREQINIALKAAGYDVEKARKEWEAQMNHSTAPTLGDSSLPAN